MRLVTTLRGRNIKENFVLLLHILSKTLNPIWPGGAVFAIQTGKIENFFLEKIARNLILKRKIKLFTRHILVKFVLTKVKQKFF